MLEMAKKWVNISNLFFKVKNKKVFLTGTNVPVGKGTFVPAGTFVPFGKGTFVPCIFPALSRPSTPLSMPLLTHTNSTYHPYAYMSHISTAMTLHTQAPTSPSDRVHLYPAFPAPPPQTTNFSSGPTHLPCSHPAFFTYSVFVTALPPPPHPNTERGGGRAVTCHLSIIMGLPAHLFSHVHVHTRLLLLLLQPSCFRPLLLLFPTLWVHTRPLLILFLTLYLHERPNFLSS